MLNVLSLFDGISAGRIALSRLPISVSNYFASEIDTNAIKISQQNWTDIVQLGDVRYLKYIDGKLISNQSGEDKIIFNGKIDLLIGGSPCQSFSFAGKRNGMTTKCKQEVLDLETYLKLKIEKFEFEGQSYLFWEYVRLLNEVQPKFFLLENVKMIDKWKLILDKAVGVEPILINSSLVSAQNRLRYYWVGKYNIKKSKYKTVEINQPNDKKIKLSEILETFDFLNISSLVGRRINERGVRDDYNKKVPLVQCLQVKQYNLKSGTITTVTKDNLMSNLPFGRYPITVLNGQKIGHYLSFNKVKKNNAINIAGEVCDIKGNDQIKRGYLEDGKSPTLTTMQGGHQEPKVAIDKQFYRKLTVKECARLQTIQDGYFDGIKPSPAYKAIGNSWTVDVIVHIFKTLLREYENE